VNPASTRGQIEGGTIMALGGALFEQVGLDYGRMASPSLAAYRVPRFGDVPAIDVVLVDRPDIPSAGAGETPLIAVAPAIANAIFAATGQRLRSLPLIRAAQAVRADRPCHAKRTVPGAPWTLLSSRCPAAAARRRIAGRTRPDRRQPVGRGGHPRRQRGRTPARRPGVRAGVRRTRPARIGGLLAPLLNEQEFRHHLGYLGESGLDADELGQVGGGIAAVLLLPATPRQASGIPGRT
jgi:hypothetical protein